MVGLVVDTPIFLQLAFGSTELMWGQIVRKGRTVLAAIPSFTGCVHAMSDRNGNSLEHSHDQPLPSSHTTRS